jgi:membrane protein YqaA with SNARE-associated domain
MSLPGIAELTGQDMIRKLYDWALRMAASRHAVPVLGGISFMESSFFPIPPDILLIPMCIARRAQAWFYATVCTATSVIGGFLGYAIGYFLWGAIGSWIISTYGLDAKFHEFQQGFADYGWWIIIAKGATPIPFKLITIASGVAKFDLLAFAAASVISRGMRFYLVAGLLYFFGEPMRDFIEKRLTLVTTAALILLIGGFVILKYL